METKKYYTPTIEDLYFGYQFEYKTHEGEWIKHTFNGADMQLIQNCFTEGNNKDTVRVPYLCKQDIIDLGWIDTEYGYFDISLSNTDDYLHRLRFLNDKNRDGSPSIEIIFIGAFDRSTVFYGKCKSKNELKKLMKDYLNIHI